MPFGPMDRLQRILPLADKGADEISSKETKIIEKTTPRMYEAMYRVARFLCDYVKPPCGLASLKSRS